MSVTYNLDFVMKIHYDWTCLILYFIIITIFFNNFDKIINIKNTLINQYL